MPTFIPARGRTLHLAGVCVNRIGTPQGVLTPDQWKQTAILIMDIWNNHPDQVIAKKPSARVVLSLPRLGWSEAIGPSRSRPGGARDGARL